MSLFGRKRRAVEPPAVEPRAVKPRIVTRYVDSGDDSSRRGRAVRTQEEVQPALLVGDEDLQVVANRFTRTTCGTSPDISRLKSMSKKRSTPYWWPKRTTRMTPTQ